MILYSSIRYGRKIKGLKAYKLMKIMDKLTINTLIGENTNQ